VIAAPLRTRRWTWRISGETIMLALLAGVAGSAQAQTGANPLIGTWQVVSRIDRDSAGRAFTEPTLGQHPDGYLIYDAAGHVAAQLMAPDRPAHTCGAIGTSDINNSTYICGYDAYFGRYEIDSVTATVVHILDGALAPGDVGRRLTRRFRVAGDTLTIQFEVRGPSGPLTRTVVWHRISP
jgi:catechol 1,2-dioxygenase